MTPDLVVGASFVLMLALVITGHLNERTLRQIVEIREKERDAYRQAWTELRAKWLSCTGEWRDGNGRTLIVKYEPDGVSFVDSASSQVH